MSLGLRLVLGLGSGFRQLASSVVLHLPGSEIYMNGVYYLALRWACVTIADMTGLVLGLRLGFTVRVRSRFRVRVSRVSSVRVRARFSF